ncbi:DNA-binding transcriptional regulator, MerR family [Sphingomonas sp. NFR15]|nr:DNA-binding transcriptional regulator, MerR family [Sphingomonas sp. NFR15]
MNTSENLESVRALVRKAPADGVRKGIQEVAEQLGVTQRTLRFYEGKGLIEPERVGSTRVYTRRDIGRMQLILRGKRLGFSIREIVEFLDLYDADPAHVEQMARLAERVRERLSDLEKQQVALVDTIRELRQIEHEAMERLEQAGALERTAAKRSRPPAR